LIWASWKRPFAAVLCHTVVADRSGMREDVAFAKTEEARAWDPACMYITRRLIARAGEVEVERDDGSGRRVPEPPVFLAISASPPDGLLPSRRSGHVGWAASARRRRFSARCGHERPSASCSGQPRRTSVTGRCSGRSPRSGRRCREPCAEEPEERMSRCARAVEVVPPPACLSAVVKREAL
jgi:hypothetical protein